MQKKLLAVVAVGTLFVTTNVFAEADSWLVRVRAVNVAPDSSSSPLAGVEVSSKTIPEVDISYFFTPSFSTELVLTYPQKHDVTLNGANLGTLKELPPTLLAQYHIATGSPFKPYVGAGLNYTRFSNVDMPGFDVDKGSVGEALQLGLDYSINDKMSVNVDIKKIYMKTDVKTTAGAHVTELKIDPVLFGIGLGWRF